MSATKLAATSVTEAPVSKVLEREFLVVCLCADWCGTCRDYLAGFKALAERYSDVGFLWVDIEHEDSGVEDWDIENFPTLMIQRSDDVLFFGPMLPHLGVLEQSLIRFLGQSKEESSELSCKQVALSGGADYNYRHLMLAKSLD